MRNITKTVVTGWLLLAVAFTVHAQTAPPTANLSAGCVESYDPAVDYFPDKAQVAYADNFSVEYFPNYKLVSVLPWPGAMVPLQYVLVQCGTPAPDNYPDASVITIPVNRFVAMTTSILPHLTDQGLLAHLVGVDTTLYTSNQQVLDMTAAGDVVEVGGGGTGGAINYEVLLAAEPDLVMTQEFYEGGTTLSELTAQGVTTVLNADYADTSPLGQAEWGKFIALFFNSEAEANSLFSGVEERYLNLARLAATAPTLPTVIAASPYSGTWYMPGADSTIAELLADAGADFLFKDEAGTSLPLDFEVVLDKGADAEFWVNANQFWLTTADMLADDSRFESFRAFQNGNVWNNNRRMNANGGSDYFESGAAHPDVILADLVKIFHPDLLPDHEFIYYQPLRGAS